MRSATAGSDGLATSVMTSVAASAVRAPIASTAMVPPTSADRSRPPTPIAWLMPPPNRSIRHITSCMPVPEAPTMPMLPPAMTLAKPRGTPLMTAVPQSGPIMSSPRS